MHIFKTTENIYFCCMLAKQTFINKNELDCIKFIPCSLPQGLLVKISLRERGGGEEVLQYNVYDLSFS